MIGDPCGERLRKTLPWLDRGTEFFLAQLASLGDDDLRLPSALPGWSRLHVVSHMARNARALMNLLRWAETGVESPMYPSPEHRRDDIDAGAQLPPADVRADAVAETDRLRAAIGTLPDGAWTHQVRTALGRPVLACEVPWMRVREVWVHAVDLGAGASFADIEPEVALALLDEAIDRLADREDCPSVTFVVEGSPAESRALGPPTRGRSVAKGSAGTLAGWVLGRTDGTGVDGARPLPELPAWL